MEPVGKMLVVLALIVVMLPGCVVVPSGGWAHGGWHGSRWSGPGEAGPPHHPGPRHFHR
jgi:hypothetical protein